MRSPKNIVWKIFSGLAVKSTLVLTAVCVLLAGSEAFAQDGGVDPSKPTNFYSYVELTPEWQKYDGGSVYSLRIMPTLAISQNHLLQAEIPISMTDFDGVDSETGFGDIRLRYFWLPYIKPDDKMTHIGGTLDVFLPVGDEDKGLGTGSWMVVPGILFGFQPTKSLSLFPIISYQYIAKDANVTAGGAQPGAALPPGPAPAGTDNEVSHGVSVEVITVINLPWGHYIQLIPKYSRIFEGATSTSFNVRAAYGGMFNAKLGWSVQFLHEFVNRDAMQNDVRISLSYYF